MRFTALSLLLLACGTAQAADWVRVNPKGQQISMYVDASSIVVDGDTRTAWTKFMNPHHSVKNNAGTKYVSVVMERMDIHCASKEWRMLSLQAFYEDGSGESNEEITSWAAVPPDTFTESVMLYLCKVTPKPAT